MLSVAIDATPLVGDRTGIGVAVSGLVTELAARQDAEIVGYGLTARGWRAVRAALPPPVRPARFPMPASPLLAAWARREWPPVEPWTGRVDVVHGTNFVVPPSRRAGRLVSVWDLTAVRYPELCTPAALRYPGLIRRAVAHGAWVHTGSQAVADEIVDNFDIDVDRVRVVPPGITPARIATARPSEGPVRPYILGLGTSEPRKDFPGLVRAFEMLATQYPDVDLLIAGPAGWGEDPLAEAIEALPYRPRIRRVGFLPDVGAVLRNAAVLAYPSVYEGFGFPPLEAMNLGVPVVATSTGSVPEVVGDAALLVPPRQPEALSVAIGEVLSDRMLRERLIALGRERAAGFTWSQAGDQMIAAYRDLDSAT